MFDERHEGRTDFHDERLPLEKTQYTENLMILTDLVSKVDKTYYLQVLLENCKYIVKEEEKYIFKKYITENLFYFYFDYICYIYVI